ncbi:MAG: GGDEF domain-containing protein, partial [Burkholderiaceae bacterium]|nr:GGDEF domain-containing protein [Burkholderiaceae bacterium]
MLFTRASRSGGKLAHGEQLIGADWLELQLVSASFMTRLGIQLGLAAAYFFIGQLSFRFANLESAFSGTFYLHEGYGLALGAILGFRAVPSVLAGHLALVLYQGVSWERASISALENGGVLALTVAFLRLVRFNKSMSTPKDFLLLVAAAIAAYQIPSRLAGFAILAGVGGLPSMHLANLTAVIEESLADESICQVLIAVVIVTTLDNLRLGRTYRYWIADAGALAAISFGLIGMLWGERGMFSPLHIFSIVYIAVMINTFWFGLHGAALANLAILVVLQWAAKQPWSPLAHLLASQDLQNSVSTILIGAITSSCLVGALLREKADKEIELTELATRDALTGLYNRRYFFEAASREISRTRRHEVDLVLLCIDLDHFKKINDTYG